MAIVEMSKIKLLGLTNNREDILNALFHCGCIELTDVDNHELDDCNCLVDSNEVIDKASFSILKNNYDRAKKVVDYVTNTVDTLKDKSLLEGKDTSCIKNFFVSFDEFISIKDIDKDILDKISYFENKIEMINELHSSKNKLQNLYSQVSVYKSSKNKFTDFKDTFFTKCLYGLIKEENLEALQKFVDKKEIVSLEVINKDKLCTISIVFHNKIEVEAIEKLNSLGFIKCPFDFDMTASEKLLEIEKDIKAVDKEENKLVKKILDKLYLLKDIKILTDRYKFEIEKLNNSEEFVYTQKTFLLEGYVPTESIEKVKEEIYNLTDAVFFEISKPKKDENPPTLCKNSSVIRQTEFITDMYSVPNYRELDPSKVVFFFFMLFMGLIMADVGYGILMVFAGLFLARKIKVDNGTRRLWYIVTIGGISTIIFGLLFDSFFGVSLIGSSVLPNPNISNGGTSENIYIMLLLCMGLGVIQIAVGYFCKAINCFKNGNVIDGIFDGIVWVFFFVGLILAGFNFILQYFKVNYSNKLQEIFSTLEFPGIIMLVSAVVISMFSAGRYEKGFGKFTKGFGAVYGLINIMSDILSYARLFGLMLSGMIIASTFNNMGLNLLNGGGVGLVLGPLVIVVGHIFNIAMGVLGAYIHDSRLQYIEFFGKFYTGEGNKFIPLGSQMDYIYLKK